MQRGCSCDLRHKAKAQKNVVKTTMTNLGSTTTAVARAIRASDQTVPTGTTRILFLQPSIVGFSPVREKRR
jgi:hypothetical protein